MAQKTKKQHFVPQCYLNAWSFSDKHQIHVYDKIADATRINNIEDVASERFFYDINFNDILSEATISNLCERNIVMDSEESTQVIEHTFANVIEPPFSDILKDVLDKALTGTPWHINNCYFISPEKKEELSVYLALQFIRIKRIREDILDSANCLSQALKDMGASPAIMEEYSVSKDKAKNVHIQMIVDDQHLEELAASFRRLTWMLGINKTRLKLYTTDNPIGTFGHIKHPFMSMNGLTSKGVEVFYPLSPNVILIMVDGDHFANLLSFERKYIELTDCENINFYNSLLTLQATRSVFSCDGNFEIINEMKRENPNPLKQSHVQLNWGGNTYYPK